MSAVGTGDAQCAGMTKIGLFSAFLVTVVLAAPAVGGKYKGFRHSELHLPATDRYTARITPAGKFSAVKPLKTRRLRWKETRRGRKSVDTATVVPFAPDTQVKVGQAWVAVQWQGDAVTLGESPRLEMLSRPTGHLQGHDLYKLASAGPGTRPTSNERRFFHANAPDSVVNGPNGIKLHIYLNGDSGIPLKVFMTDGVTMQAGQVTPVKLMNFRERSTLERATAL